MEIEYQKNINCGPSLIDERYQPISVLGEGTYGQVSKCLEKSTQQIVAVKRIKLEIFQGDGFPSSSMREISILRKLHHPNIVMLKEVSFQVEDSNLLMVFECMECDLKQYMDAHKNLSMTEIKIIKQILLGVDFCHSKQILHRDLKPQNILLSSNNGGFEIKVSDFGLARTFMTPMDRYTKEIATLWYRAPEIMLGDDSYSVTIDVWAVGCILLELMTRKPVFRGESQIDQIFRIFQVLGTPNEVTYPGVSKLPDFNERFPKFPGTGIKCLIPKQYDDPHVLDLLEKMLALDPMNRIFCREALNHPFFGSMQNSF